jgi:hypothetical protein
VEAVLYNRKVVIPGLEDDDPVARDFETALEAALEAAGFTVVGTSPFRIEGTREGFWFGFTHDAVLRSRPGRTVGRVAGREDRPDGGEACRLAGRISEHLRAAG